MKFTSIRKKLISRVSLILLLAFSVTLAVVAYTNYMNAQQGLRKTESSIRDALVAKGRILVNNNSQALKGMVDDNAFSAVQFLVSSTVKEDQDIIYGIFMDVDLLPWTIANEEQPDGVLSESREMEDEISIWASQLTASDFKLYPINGKEVYEFGAPVILDDEILGFIRYGMSTLRMQQELSAASLEADQQLLQTLLILSAVILLTLMLGILATRKMAASITTPLDGLTEGANTIASGNYEAEVAVESNDEIGLLADNFNLMRVTIQKKIKDLGDLNSTGEVLAVLMDQTRALEEVLKRMHKHTNVSRGSVYLFNENRQLQLKAFYPPEIATDPNRSSTTFNEGEGILGQAAKEGSIIYVADTSVDERFVADSDSRHPPMALLCVPLVDNDTTIGVMNFSGSVDQVVFEDSDYEFTSSIARLLVTTVKNIRMREVIEEQNRTLEHKVEERTLALQEKTNDILNMMQNMHQGLFTIMGNYIVHHEYAAYLEEILETHNIANRNVMDLLFTGSSLGSDRFDQVETAIGALLGEDEMMFDFNKHLLVGEITRKFDDGREKIIELDWDPILAEGIIDKIMVTVRDVTELKSLEAEAEEQKKELEIIGQILKLGAEKYNQFVDSAFDFIDKNRQLIQSDGDLDLDLISVLFRNMHTIKGNARTFNFDYVTNSVHEAEQSYDEMRRDESIERDRQRLLNELNDVEACVKLYADIGGEKLGMRSDTVSAEASAGAMPVGVEVISQIVNSFEDLLTDESLSDVARARLGDSRNQLLAIGGKKLAEALDGVVESMPSLSKELGKPEPKVDIVADHVLMRPNSFPLLSNVFMHIFRNSMDHGIENAEDRKEAGKTPAGTIHLNANPKPQCLELLFKDDGRGLNISRLRQKLIDNGHSMDELSNSLVANSIFDSGLSTAETVTEVSGRGVGMDAVKKFIEEEGGKIEIVLREEEASVEDYMPFALKIDLPDSMFVPMTVH